MASAPKTDPTVASFGACMRHERERRKLSIAAIADSTKILGALLEGMESDDVSRWPTGFYRRAFMRAYASAIGLDPEATVREFLERFPDPVDDPVPASGGVVGARSGDAAAGGAASRLARRMAIRVGLPRLGAWFSDGALVRGFRLRCLAAAVDLVVLGAIGAALYTVLGSFWAPLCAAAAFYYSGGILLLGNTPGVCLFADPERTIAKTGRVYLNLLRRSLVAESLMRLDHSVRSRVTERP